LARSLNVSDDTIDLVFGKQASAGVVNRGGGSHGEHAADTSPRKTTTMTTPLIKRIEDAQERLVALKDQLTDHLGTIGDEPDEASSVMTEELNGKIAIQQRSLDSLKQAEERLAATIPEPSAVVTKSSRPFAVAAKKVNPADYVLRALVAAVVSKATRGDKSPLQALVERYGEDGKIDDATRTVFESVTRTATAPATTTTSGWASQLVEQSNQGFMELLMPASVYPGLASRGLRLNFGRSGIIAIPNRTATPTIAGSFVAEGSPIPVRQGAFGSVTFTPKKMAVISTFTREIFEHSTPAIEGLIRNAIQEDTSVAMDTVLLDATAASTTRPAGLRFGVTVTPATAGGGFAALVGDLKALAGALITASNGNLRSPVWVMNPVNALAVSLTQNAGGDFPFASEINNNTFQGYPVIMSATVTAGMVFLVDAADFVAIEGGAPRFDVSDQATLHMEDTTPLAISAAGAPNTVAAPVRSLYQTDSMALRMIMDVNWGMRRAGVIAWTQNVTW
nr:phage major capsid protein [Pyrinomonadaceae bacterium]